jgi:hypothetical protein
LPARRGREPKAVSVQEPHTEKDNRRQHYDDIKRDWALCTYLDAIAMDMVGLLRVIIEGD